MNDNKLSTNLSTINTAVSKIRTSLNASNLDINKLADRVAEVKTSLSDLENNMVYEVNSREGMSALTGIADGSVCLIKGTETRGIKKWDKFVNINFPDRIVLNTPLEQDEVINIGIKIKGTGHGTLTGSLTTTSFIFGAIIKGQGASAKSITYTAQGNTYVRTDSYGSPVISAGELQWDDSYTFDDRLSQFFIADILLEETNIYYKNSWVPVNAGETLELKTTTAEQASVILEQTATNNRLNTELATANATIQQHELTITEQENTITLKDAEIAALNARIEELENPSTPEPDNKSGTSVKDGDVISAMTRLKLNPIKSANALSFPGLCGKINAETDYSIIGTDCDGNYILKGIHDTSAGNALMGPSSSDGSIVFYTADGATILNDTTLAAYYVELMQSVWSMNEYPDGIIIEFQKDMTITINSTYKDVIESSSMITYL